MSLEVIKQKISSINAQSAKLNDNRKYQLGMRTQLQSQLKDAVADYESKYGVSLSLDSLDAEIQSVSSEMEKEIESITNILNLINSGRYEDAERLVSGGVEGQEQPTSGVENNAEAVTVPHVESAVPHVDEGVVPHIEGAVPHVEPAVPEMAVPHVEPAVPEMEVPHVAEGVTPNVEPAVPHVEPAVPHVEAPVAPTVPVAPRPIPSPVPDEPIVGSDSSERKPITSFNAILGGSAFNPQQ